MREISRRDSLRLLGAAGAVYLSTKASNFDAFRAKSVLARLPEAILPPEPEDYWVRLAREHDLQERVRLESLLNEVRSEGPRPPTLDYYTSQVPRDFFEYARHLLVPDRPTYSKDVLLNPIYRVITDEPIVALTTDDGFAVQDEIVALYKKEGVGATFFIIDSSLRPDIVDAVMNSASLEMGNHADHSDFTKSSKEHILYAVNHQNETLQRMNSKARSKPYMRPYGGNINASVMETLAGDNEMTVLWNISGDAGSYTPDQLVDLYRRQFTQKAQAGVLNGSIILTHFTPNTLAALPRIIETLRKDFHVEPVSLSALFSKAKYLVNARGEFIVPKAA